MKPVYVIVASLAAGFAGGIVGNLLTKSRGPIEPALVVRARAFELVDEAGQAISYWGIDKNDYAVLAFGNRWPADLAKGHPHPPLRDLEHQMLALGVTGDERGGGPFLQMRAPDGKTRVRIDVDMWGKPILAMEDEAGWKVGLGIYRSDTPGPQDNDWALTFGTEPERVWLGMHTETVRGRRYVQGGLSVTRDKLEVPYGPPK